MEDIKKYTAAAKRMVEDDSRLIVKLQALDRMWRNDWSLPPEIDGKEWIYKAIDSSPSDALDTATRSFSANHPRPKLTPTSDDPDDKSMANLIEDWMKWAYRNADKRSETRLTPDGMRSALRYDKVCIQVIHLPTHYESIKVNYESIKDEKERTEKLTILEKRQKAALRKGDFIIKMRSPLNVHHRYSELGLEKVLLVQQMRAADIVALWEKLASFLNDGSDGWQDQMWTYCDLDSIDRRVVWVCPDKSEVDDVTGVILDEATTIPFISWAIRTGGTSLDELPEDRCNPYLNNVYTAGSWDLANTTKTLSVSEVFKYSGQARVITKTPTGEGIEIDYSGDTASINLKPTDEVQPFPPQPIDRAVLEIYDREAAAMDAQTRVRVLMNPNFPGGTAFATINALMKSALDGLQPWRELAEYAFADMFEILLLWIDHYDQPVIFRGINKKDRGKEYTFGPTDFNINNISVDVELSGDLPTDRVERINSAILMYERLKWSLASIMEELGETDPQAVINDRTFEDMTALEIEAENQLVIARAQLAAQAMSQPPQQQQPTEEAYQEEAPAQPAFDVMQGQGTDMGGLSQAQAAPGMTREQVAGMDQEGNPLAV